MLVECSFGSVTGLLASVTVGLLTWHYVMMLYKRRGMPPGPVSLPLIGTMYIMFRSRASELPFRIAELSRKYGRVFSMQMPTGSCIVVMTDIQVIRDTFVRNIDVAGRPFHVNRQTSQKIFNPFFPKAGIVFSDYDEQLKLQRNIAMVVLRSLGYGKKSVETSIVEEARFLAEEFQTFNGASFNPTFLLNIAVTNIIVSLLFGERYEYNDPVVSHLQQIITEIFESIQKTVALDYIWFYRYLPSGRRQLRKFQATANELNAMATQRIAHVRQQMAAGEEPNNFIATYLREVEKSGGKLDDRSHQLVKDFFGAGAETTSTTLAWALYLMAKYPDVQDKARDEIHKLVGEGRSTTLQDRDSLPYVEATLTEIFRVTPTAVGSLPHYTIADTQIQGYHIPKGTQVQALITPVVWDPILFPEPHTLKPERHINSQGQFVKNENITPFGVGRRSCLGEQLARQELFLFFTHLIQRFRFQVPEGETLPAQVGDCFLTYRPPAYNIAAIPIH